MFANLTKRAIGMTDAISDAQLDEEYKRIRKRRAVAFNADPDEDSSHHGTKPEELVGLALSGGGLRSALFNHGFIQAISHTGLLRYVDYLCSVSGGGYIAGHLMTKSKSKNARTQNTAARNFHENENDWHFGRDPENGETDLCSLRGIGQYLNRSFRFFAEYWLYHLPVMVLYLSLLGTLATLVAIYYRTFDSPVFRIVYEQILGIEFGSEFLIALIPTIMGASIALLLGMLLATFGRLQSGIASLLVWGLVVFPLIASIAIAMGNGVTTINVGGKSSTWYLNGFATYLAVVGGLIQILVFLGRERLFLSERSEAANWQRVAQSFLSYGAIVFFFFVAVHIMGQENISEYVAHRDPYLTTGDISNWSDIEVLEKTLETRTGEGGKATNEDAWSLGALSKLSAVEWSKKTHLYRSESKTKEFWGSWLGSNAPWNLGLRSKENEKSFPPPPLEPKEINLTTKTKVFICTCVFGRWCQTDAWTQARCIQKQRLKYLDDRNKRLEAPALTTRLIKRLSAQEGTPKPPALNQLLKVDVVKSRFEQLPISRRSRLVSLLAISDLDSSNMASMLPIDRVRLNRDLLELSCPGVIRPYHTLSTAYVQPHDQLTRWRVLNWWLLLMAGCLLLTRNLNRVNYLYHFYTAAIKTAFLAGNPGYVSGKTKISDLAPEENGLPFPIFLAARLKRDVRRQVTDPCPVAITPSHFSIHIAGRRAESPTNEYKRYRLVTRSQSLVPQWRH